jgi:peptidoglycan/LPS O-acetylase OafA/YrhL
MGWILLFLVLIAAALGVLGLVVKATIFLVLTILMTVIVLGYIAYLIVRRQARRLQKDFEKRLQPPSRDYRY